MATNLVAFEVSGLTLNLNTSNVPTPVMGASPFEGLSLVDCKILNSTTSKYITLNRQIALDNTAILDMENHNAYVKETLEPIISGIQKDSGRGTWLPIIGGKNTITYSDAGNTGTTVTLKWYDRSN
jgi:phage-related protein